MLRYTYIACLVGFFLGAFAFPLASSRLSTCPHVSVWLPIDGFPSNFVLGTYLKICREIPNLARIGQKYQALYMKTKVGFIVTIGIKSPTENPLPVKWYQAVRINNKEQTLRERATTLPLLCTCHLHFLNTKHIIIRYEIWKAKQI